MGTLLTLMVAAAQGGAAHAEPAPDMGLPPLVIHDCFPGVWLGPRPPDAVDPPPETVWLTRIPSGRSYQEWGVPDQRRADLPPRPEVEARWGGTAELVLDDRIAGSGRNTLIDVHRGSVTRLADLHPDALVNAFSYQRAPSGGAFAIRGDARVTGRGELSVALALAADAVRRPPLDLTLVVPRQVSSWIDGFDRWKKAVGAAVAQLRPGDRLDLVVYDATACTALDGWVAGRDDPALPARALAAIGTGSAHPDWGRRVQGGLQAAEAALAEADRAAAGASGRLRWSMTTSAFRPPDEALYPLLAHGFDRVAHLVAEDLRISLTLPPELGVRHRAGRGARDGALPPSPPLDLLDGEMRLFPMELRFRGAAPDPAATLAVDLAWTDADTGERLGWRWETTVGELLAQGSRNVDKARAVQALADMLVAEAVSDGFCKAARHELDDRVALARDAELDFVMERVDDRCERWPRAAWDYVDEVEDWMPVGLLEVCAAPPPGAVGSPLGRRPAPARMPIGPGCWPHAPGR